VSGMHYTGMAAMHLTEGSMAATGGSSGMSFLVPLLVGVTIVTFAVTLVISLSPTEDEIHEDARLRDRIATGFSATEPASQQPPAQPSLWTPQAQPQPLPQAQAQPSLWTPHNQQPQSPQQPQTPPKALPTRRPSSDALAGRNRTPRQPG
jgi:hypothetical protein